MDKAEHHDRRHPAEDPLLDLVRAEDPGPKTPADPIPTSPTADTPSWLLARQLAYAMVTAEIDGDPELERHVERWHEIERAERDDLDRHVMKSLRAIAADIAHVAGESTGLGAENVIQVTRLTDPQLDGPHPD